MSVATFVETFEVKCENAGRNWTTAAFGKRELPTYDGFSALADGTCALVMATLRNDSVVKANVDWRFHRGYVEPRKRATARSELFGRRQTPAGKRRPCKGGGDRTSVCFRYRPVRRPQTVPQTTHYWHHQHHALGQLYNTARNLVS